VSDFYQKLAEALTAWQRVEWAMHEICRAAIHAGLPGALSAGFHGLEHTAAQIRFTDAAVNFWCTAQCATDSQAKWQGDKNLPDTGLTRQINNQLRTRNALAHFAVYTEAQKKIEHEKVYLEPSFTDTRYISGGKTKSHYTVKEIQAASIRFVDLSRKLFSFARDMGQLEVRQQVWKE
jgi:hypothetical protein